LTQKKVDFLLFKAILELMKAKKHLTNEGLIEIISIKASINKGLTTLLYNNFTSVVPIIKPKVNLVIINQINLIDFVVLQMLKVVFLLIFVLIEKIIIFNFMF